MMQLLRPGMSVLDLGTPWFIIILSIRIIFFFLQFGCQSSRDKPNLDNSPIIVVYSCYFTHLHIFDCSPSVEEGRWGTCTGAHQQLQSKQLPWNCNVPQYCKPEGPEVIPTKEETEETANKPMLRGTHCTSTAPCCSAPARTPSSHSWRREAWWVTEKHHEGQIANHWLEARDSCSMLHLILKLSTPYSCPICEWLIVVVDSIHSIFLKWIVDQNWIGNLNLFHLSFLHCFSASAWCNRATVQPYNHLQALASTWSLAIERCWRQCDERTVCPEETWDEGISTNPGSGCQGCGDGTRWDTVTGMVWGETVKHHWWTVNGWLTVIVNSTASVFCITYPRPNSTGHENLRPHMASPHLRARHVWIVQPRHSSPSASHRRNMDKISSNGVETGHNWTKHWCISSAVTVQRRLGTKHTTL